MKSINQTTLKNLLRKYEGKRIRILTKSNLHYDCKLLEITEDSILIFDKVGNEVIILISEVLQVTKRGGENA